MEKTLTVEERLARIEEVLEKSGLGLLAQEQETRTACLNRPLH